MHLDLLVPHLNLAIIKTHLLSICPLQGCKTASLSQSCTVVYIVMTEVKAGREGGGKLLKGRSSKKSGHASALSHLKYLNVSLNLSKEQKKRIMLCFSHLPGI